MSQVSSNDSSGSEEAGPSSRTSPKKKKKSGKGNTPKDLKKGHHSEDTDIKECMSEMMKHEEKNSKKVCESCEKKVKLA